MPCLLRAPGRRTALRVRQFHAKARPWWLLALLWRGPDGRRAPRGLTLPAPKRKTHGRAVPKRVFTTRKDGKVGRARLRASAIKEQLGKFPSAGASTKPRALHPATSGIAGLVRHLHPGPAGARRHYAFRRSVEEPSQGKELPCPIVTRCGSLLAADVIGLESVSYLRGFSAVNQRCWTPSHPKYFLWNCSRAAFHWLRMRTTSLFWGRLSSSSMSTKL